MYPNAINTSLALLRIVSKADSIGNKRTVIDSSHEVLGITKSLTSSEFQSSTAINKVYDFKVSIQALLYNDEKFALIKGVIYKIERTYLNGQFMELYLKESDYNYEALLDENKSW